MKLTITTSHWYGAPSVCAVAIIPKSKKLGVPHKLQKTWTVKTVAPKFTVEEMRPAFEAAAKRWEAEKMATMPERKERAEAAAEAKITERKKMAEVAADAEIAKLKLFATMAEAVKEFREVSPPPTPASVPAP